MAENSNNKLRQEIEIGNIKMRDLNSDMFHCFVCSVDISGIMQAESHAVGGKHAKKLKIHSQAESIGLSLPKKICLGSSSPAFETMEYRTPVSPEETYFCTQCKIRLTGDAPWKQHINGKTHAKKLNQLKSMKTLGFSSSSSSSRSSSPSPSQKSVMSSSAEENKYKSRIPTESSHDPSKLKKVLDFSKMNLGPPDTVEEVDNVKETGTAQGTTFTITEYEEIFSIVESLKKKIMVADLDGDRSTQVGRNLDRIFLSYRHMYESLISKVNCDLPA